MTAKEVKPFTEADQTITRTPPSVVEMMTELQSLATTELRDPNEVSLEILQRILETESFEEAVSSAVYPVEDLMAQGRTVLIESVDWSKSSLGELGVFAIIKGQLDGPTGQKIVTTCGARNVVAILYRVQKEGRLPWKAKCRQNRTQSDYDVYWLEPVQ